MKNKVIVVVGPTAVGKTKISIALAKIFGCEIINGDSIAVYKDLNIGSAKPTKEEMTGVKHHLIDIVEPGADYSVADFQISARRIVDNKELSIICGGTGLYVQAALFNYEFKAAKRDESLKARYEHLSNEQLYQLLKDKDSNLDETKIHANNRKRVLRALEIIEDTGKSIHSYDKKKEALYDYFIVYLSLERELLYERINKRVDIMLEAGLLDEVKALYEKNIYPKGIGYREFFPYFKGEISLEKAIDDVKKNSRHLAKRQETWFKNQMDSHFYSVDLHNIDNTIDEIKKDIEEWMK